MADSLEGNRLQYRNSIRHDFTKFTGCRFGVVCCLWLVSLDLQNPFLLLTHFQASYAGVGTVVRKARSLSTNSNFQVCEIYVDDSFPSATASSSSISRGCLRGKAMVERPPLAPT